MPFWLHEHAPALRDAGRTRPARGPSLPPPAPALFIQRQCACGGNCPRCQEKWEPLTPFPTAPRRQESEFEIEDDFDPLYFTFPLGRRSARRCAGCQGGAGPTPERVNAETIVMWAAQRIWTHRRRGLNLLSLLQRREIAKVHAAWNDARDDLLTSIVIDPQQERFRGSRTARQRWVRVLLDRWNDVIYELDQKAAEAVVNAIASAQDKARAAATLVTDPKLIAHIESNPDRETISMARWGQMAKVGDVVTGRRFVSIKYPDLYYELVGHEGVYFNEPAYSFGSDDFMADFAQKAYKGSKGAGLLFPAMIAAAGEAISFIPGIGSKFIGPALKQLGEAGMREVNLEQPLSAKEMLKSYAVDVALNVAPELPSAAKRFVGAARASKAAVAAESAGAHLFEGISKETAELLERRPGLAAALQEHPGAADLFKLCESPCFPSFMTDEEIVERLTRLERIQAEAQRHGIALDRKAMKKLLHKQDTVAAVDKTLGAIEEQVQKRIRQSYSGEPLAEGYEDVFEHPGVSKTSTPGGKAEPVKAAVGKFAHADAEFLQNHPKVLEDLVERTGTDKIFSEKLEKGLIPEYEIPHPTYPGAQRPRIDRLWRSEDTIIEIKPNTRMEKGISQAQQYADWMNRFERLPGGRVWKVKVITYDQALLTKYLKSIGWLP